MIYVLVTLYSVERHDGKTAWIVYGHLCPGCNDKFGEFESEQEAIAEALAQALLAWAVLSWVESGP